VVVLLNKAAMSPLFGNSTKYDEAVIRVSAWQADIGDRDVGIVGAPDG